MNNFEELQTKLTSQESEHAKFKRLIAKLRIERNDMHNQLVECQGVIHKLAKLGNVGAEQLQKVMVNVKGTKFFFQGGDKIGV